MQFADAVNALMGSKAYRPAFKDEEILELIRKETVAGKYNKAISKIFFDCYNEIMEYVSVRAEETMSTYKKLNQQYREDTPLATGNHGRFPLYRALPLNTTPVKIWENYLIWRAHCSVF